MMNDTLRESGTKIRVPRVLFVDDDELVGRVFARMLKRHGYLVTVVSSGAEALTYFAELPFDVVISDQNMPGMQGSALLELLYEKHGFARAIICSGAGDSLVCAVPGVRRIHKPWSEEQVLEILTALLGPLALTG